MPIKTSAASRIAAHTVRPDDSDCLLWTLSTSTQGGYPMCLDDHGKLDYAYRIAFKLEHGANSLDGLDCHHTCETRTCLNVDHMQALTEEEHAAAHAAERLARNRSAVPQIRNLAAMGRDRKEIKILSGAGLMFIDALLKADTKLKSKKPVINVISMPVAQDLAVAA